jgi:AsmA-like C-terminal region
MASEVSMTRRSKIGFGASVLAVAGVSVTAALLVARIRVPLNEYVRQNIVAALREHFASDVRLSTLSISLFPQLRVVGQGLLLHGKESPDAPPLIEVRKFVLNGELRELFRPVPHFQSLFIEGLEMHIPAHTADRAIDSSKKPSKLNFIIDDVISNDAVIDILRRDADKPTLEFAIHKLKIKKFQPGLPAAFHATLQNPRPIGEIEVDGDLGPWNAKEPSLTPMNGKYEYTHADLGTFPGISGYLSSKGEFEGVLDYISVQGTTQVPDFTVAAGGHSVALNTEFDAVVDGTNGNTYLKSVAAHFLRTSILIRGEIAKNREKEDRAISLQVSSDSARVEDLLRLAVSSPQPLLTGAVTLNTKVSLRLHQGQNVFDRLELAGQFGVTSAKFSSDDVQDKINNLSRKGLGKPDTISGADAVSDLGGSFTLKAGLLDFSHLKFSVPGAAVRLTGKYDLRGESVDFRGTLRLDAKLSQTTTGARSLLLKFVDPFFAKQGAGALLPIKIEGSRENPSFGLDLHRSNPKTFN